MEILRIEALSFTYPQCKTPSVSDLSLSVKSGSFNVLCGATGSGKSTLLSLIKRETAPLGSMTGRIIYRGRDINELDAATAASKIGFVSQRPEQQLVCDKVWHELAFGLENMGVPQQTIARRVAEMASYFGIGSWYDRNVAELSGGQKQLLNLAAVMVTDPDILILDEPTAQLDPIAAADFIATLKKLNTDLSLTVLIAEHRLEDLIPICDELIVMKNGRLVCAEEPRSACVRQELDEGMLPSSVRLHRLLGRKDECPLTVREGRRMVTGYDNRVRRIEDGECENYDKKAEIALELENVYFRYDRQSEDILRGLDMKVRTGEIYCVLGGNGAGKSTMLGCAASLRRPHCGRIKVFGRKTTDYKDGSLYDGCLSLLVQDVQTVFLHNTVREELNAAKVDESALPFDLSGLYDKHPYDLSGGEQQLVALAEVLAKRPRLLLCDEPTKGLDSEKKKKLAEIFAKLKDDGVTIVIVTHDVEFAATVADRCALFFRGRIVSQGRPRDFFSDSRFYTTAVSRMTKGHYDNAVTVDDAVRLCKVNGESG